jgi:DNA-directed RNA polymerase specialized sigma24 family protein
MTQPAAIALDPREVLRADAASKEPILGKRLLRFCFARTRDADKAADAASEAIALTLAAEGWHRWKHDGRFPPTQSLLMHLCDMAKDVIKKDRERASTWREVEGDPERDAKAPDSSPEPGAMPAKWEKHDDAMRRADDVMARLDEDAREMLRVEAGSDEELDGEELAAKLGWTVKQVYRARERVMYHRDLVLAREKRKAGPP